MNKLKTQPAALRILILTVGLSLSCSARTYHSIQGSLCIQSQFTDTLNHVLAPRLCAFHCDSRVSCQAFTTNDGPCELFVFDRFGPSVRNCNCARTGQVFVKFKPGSVAGTMAAAILAPEANTDWGDWGSWEYCTAGAFVSSFQLKVQDFRGNADDTALNAVKMTCSHAGCVANHSLTSSAGQWGNWRDVFQCGMFYTGIQFRSEPSQGSLVDDTAGNNVRLLCGGGWHDGGGLDLGDWTAPKYCPANCAICGLRTKIEPQQLIDNTSLNKVEVLCCSLDTYSPF